MEVNLPRYEEADLIKAAEEVHKAIKIPGRSPQYHRYQIQQLSFNWPTLFMTVMHLVDVMDGLEANGRTDQSKYDGFPNSET